MRIGVLVMPTDPWPETQAIVRRIEDLGSHHLWIYDHLTWRRYRDRPWHATYPLLAGIATVTNASASARWSPTRTSAIRSPWPRTP